MPQKRINGSNLFKKYFEVGRNSEKDISACVMDCNVCLSNDDLAGIFT